MSEKHNKLPAIFDLDEMGLGDDEKDEPDTDAAIKIIVNDAKTPGIANSLLALMGYQRKSHRHLHKRIDKLEQRDGRRMAWIAGAVAASTLIGGAIAWLVHSSAPVPPPHPSAQDIAREVVKAQQK